MGGTETSRSALARRVDDGLGVAEEVEFFGGDERLFGCRHLPAGGPADGVAHDRGLLVCSPVLTDFGANYRREVDLARRLAAAGVPVARFHPRGCGHSDGARADLTLDTLTGDAAAALDWFGATVPVRTTIVLATRLAALAAAAAVADRPGVPLALWEPVTRPRAYLRAGLRARAVHRLARRGGDGAGEPAETEQPDDELARQGYLDLLGVPVGPGLYGTPADRTLVAALGKVPRPVLVVQFEPGDLRRDLRDAAEGWRAAGFDITTAVCPSDESWWFIPDRAPGGADAVAATAAWVGER